MFLAFNFVSLNGVSAQRLSSPDVLLSVQCSAIHDGSTKQYAGKPFRHEDGGGEKKAFFWRQKDAEGQGYLTAS